MQEDKALWLRILNNCKMIRLNQYGIIALVVTAVLFIGFSIDGFYTDKTGVNAIPGSVIFAPILAILALEGLYLHRRERKYDIVFFKDICIVTERLHLKGNDLMRKSLLKPLQLSNEVRLKPIYILEEYGSMSYLADLIGWKYTFHLDQDLPPEFEDAKSWMESLMAASSTYKVSSEHDFGHPRLLKPASTV